MVKCLPKFEYFYRVLENKNIIFKIRRSKFIDNAALNGGFMFEVSDKCAFGQLKMQIL